MIAGEDYIILKKHQETCVFCKEGAGELFSFKEKLLCAACLRQLQELALSPEEQDA